MANICSRLSAIDNLGTASQEWGSTYTKNITVSNTANVKQLAVNGDITATGDITGARVFNAVYNDYAEWFERGDDAEVGHIIALDETSAQERYVKATNKSKVIVGICTGNYAHIIGGEYNDNYETYNLKKFIPVSLAGRVPVYVKGTVHIGDFIIPTDAPGIGKASKERTGGAVGIALEQNLDSEIKKVKVLVIK